ncbi:MAG: hypothetical protein JRD68_16555, partial [Deltaproteobacteria bacterium]|nr:hypothetical protein [Deltaproteobacteria bacterium]
MKRLTIFSVIVFLAGFIFVQNAACGDWIKYSGNPIITGTPPTGGPSILEINDEYVMWYLNGWEFWRAVSSDGLNWTNHDPVFVDRWGVALGTV